MSKTINKQAVIDTLVFQAGIEKQMEHTEAWTPDYTEGFVDGLHRAIELIMDEDFVL